MMIMNPRHFLVTRTGTQAFSICLIPTATQNEFNAICLQRENNLSRQLISSNARAFSFLSSPGQSPRSEVPWRRTSSKQSHRKQLPRPQPEENNTGALNVKALGWRSYILLLPTLLRKTRLFAWRELASLFFPPKDQEIQTYFSRSNLSR